MSRSLIPKETIEALELGAPEGYDVMENFFSIDIYGADEVEELFELLYLPEDKMEDADYLIKMIGATKKYTADDLKIEESEAVLTVEQKLIHEHRRASAITIDDELVFAHYQ